jgi:penicillin-insensitive murein endopeptidase
MVDSKRLRASKAFSSSEIQILQHFASLPEVDRILVHFTLKRELCRRFGAPDAGSSNTGEWIRKIRPWFGHDRHFHVRIRCPAGSPLCKDGEPIPAGNGCDSTLDWWWSDEARQDEGKNLHRQQSPVMPELPAACSQLLHSS